MLAFALDKNTGRLLQLEDGTPSALRRHRRENPDHVVLTAPDPARLSRTLSLYGI